MSLPAEAIPHRHRFVLPVWSPGPRRSFTLGLAPTVEPRCVNKQCACGEVAHGLSLEERTTLSVVYA